MNKALGTLKLVNTDSGLSSWTLADGTEASPPVRDALIDALDYHLSRHDAMTNGEPHDTSYVHNMPDGWGLDLRLK